MTMFSSYKNQMRVSTDEVLRIVKAFFDTPELRRYYSGLIEDLNDELTIRGQLDEADNETPKKTNG